MRGYSNNKQNKTRELSFHRLPRNETLVEKYQIILNSIFPNKKHTRICGAHFKNGKRESRDELPLWRFPPKALSTPKRKAPAPRGPIPQPKPRNEHFKSYKEKLLKKQLDKKIIEVNSLQVQVQEFEKKIEKLKNSLDYSLANTNTANQKVEACKEDIRLLEQKLIESTFGHEKFVGNDDKMLFYTGLTNDQFNALWQFLEPEICTPKRDKISRKNELFAVLLKCRLGLQNEDLADRFGITRQSISRIFEGWITFLDNMFSKVNQWPSLEYIDKYMPTNFTPKYALTRVILDCTEIKVQRASNCDLQSMNFSSYKNCATVKGLVCTTPDGVGCFFSNLMPGSTSDNEITLQSGVLDLVEPGRGVMTVGDLQSRIYVQKKGFTILLHQCWRPSSLQ